MGRTNESSTMHLQEVKKCSFFFAASIFLLLLLDQHNLERVDAFIPTPALVGRSQSSCSIASQNSPSLLQRIPYAAGPLNAKKKGSMADKRKKRARRLPPRQVVVPEGLENSTPVGKWEKTTATGVKPKQEEQPEVKDPGAEEKAKAAQLIESQRKSVATLTYIREKVEALPYAEIAAALKENDNRGYYVLDDFLGDELASEIAAESTSLLNSDKLKPDLTHIGSGEYVSEIKGGQDQYADCPRCVEYVVSLTRFMPPLLDGEKVMGELQSLDSTASMASLRAFDRKARLSSLELLTPGTEEPPRPFGYANGGDDEDARKVTVLYFLTPSEWTKECGGGVTVRSIGGEEDGNSNDGDVLVEAKKDRLVIFRSDTCLLRLNAWKGTDELMNGGCLATHLVKSRS
mmetsp:Transcript_1789/g.2655  ORF Transcript_1789/g.2655 Transcript_1789/m.2655 type:complete len:403 (+) Transcript_1789:201-1409(+)